VWVATPVVAAAGVVEAVSDVVSSVDASLALSAEQFLEGQREESLPED